MGPIIALLSVIITLFSEQLSTFYPQILCASVIFNDDSHYFYKNKIKIIFKTIQDKCCINSSSCYIRLCKCIYELDC